MARILRQLFLHAHRETTRYVEIQQPHPIFAAASTKARTPPSHLSFDMQERDGGRCALFLRKQRVGFCSTSTIYYTDNFFTVRKEHSLPVLP